MTFPFSSDSFMHTGSLKLSAADICHLFFSDGQQCRGTQLKRDGGVAADVGKCCLCSRSAPSVPNATPFA